MSTELAIIKGGQLPAHLQALAEEPSNIITGDRGASLGVKGKVFTVTADGQSTPLMRRDQESGEEVARQVLPVVILDYGVRMGRAFYEGAYDPNEVKGPTCYSLDSVIPEPEVEEKQSDKCATCPMAQKGSATTDSGKAATACGQHRILTVVPAAPAAMRQFPPLRLRIAQTSNYDGKSPDARAQGRFAFQNYLDSLKSMGVPNTRLVVTSLSFDSAAAYPKLFFRATGYVSEEQNELIQEFLAGDKVEEIMGWTGTIAAANGTNTRPAVIPTGGMADDDEDDGEIVAAKAALAKATQTKAEKAAATKAAKAAAAAAKKHPADAALDAAGAKNPALNKAAAVPGTFTAPAAEPGEDEDDYAMRVAKARKDWKAAVLAQQAAAAAPAPAPAPEKAKPAVGEKAPFVAPDQQDGEDEDDYAMRVAQARKAWKAAGPALVPEFKAPKQNDGEDEDDYAMRVAQARKAYKAKHGAPAAAKTTVVAEPVAKGEEKPAEKFLPEAAALDAIGGDDEEEPAAKPVASKPKAGTKAAGAKAPVEAKPVEVPTAVAALLDTWDE